MRVSLLVPVYGVEKYIGQCAASLFGQTYGDIEYVFVDDCTPDDSIRVLKEVASRYPERENQIRIIRHERNRGLGAARKTALQAATADYVMHIDSDDYLALDAVHQLVAEQQHSGADIVTGGFSYHYENGHEEHFLYPALDRSTTLKLMLIQNTLMPHIWGRLVKKSLYVDHDIWPIEGINMAEDLALTPRLIMVAANISYIKGSIYRYRINSGASTFSNQLSRKNIVSYLKAMQVLFLFFKAHDPQGHYRFALDTGMLNAWYLGMKSGLGKDEVGQICTYRPWGFCHAVKRRTLQDSIFWLILFLFARKTTLPLLRFSFLTVKWLYKKRLHYWG